MTRLWLVALAMCGLVAGQSTARIEGRVVTQSGEPVRKATVRLQGGQQSYVEVSDGAGKFAIEGLPAGRFQTSAARAGFTEPQSNTPQPNWVTVQAGQSK